MLRPWFCSKSLPSHDGLNSRESFALPSSNHPCRAPGNVSYISHYPTRLKSPKLRVKDILRASLGRTVAVLLTRAGAPQQGTESPADIVPGQPPANLLALKNPKCPTISFIRHFRNGP